MGTKRIKLGILCIEHWAASHTVTVVHLRLLICHLVAVMRRYSVTTPPQLNHERSFLFVSVIANIIDLCAVLGLEMYLRVVQVEERRLVLWGRSWEIWSKPRDLWMKWFTPAPHSSRNLLNIRTIRNILHTHLCLSALSLLLCHKCLLIVCCCCC